MDRTVEGRGDRSVIGYERRVDELHDKMDELAEAEAAHATDIVCLKWGLRLLFASVAGLSGATFSGIL